MQTSIRVPQLHIRHRHDLADCRIVVDLDLRQGDAEVNVKTIVRRVGRTINNNSPSILSAVAIGGVFTTAFYAVKNHQQATDLLEEDPDLGEGHERIVNYVRATWQCYIPTAVSGTVTVASILGANRIGHRRAAAAQAAFVVAERAYAEYRDQIIEEFGKQKDESIRGKIAENRLKENKPEIVIAGPGNVLCCELYTGRYFMSDMETLRRAENELNARLLNQDQACLEDFYDMVGLFPTSYSGEIGWTSDKLMKLEFTTVLSEDGRPVLAFEYNYHRPLYEGLF